MRKFTSLMAVAIFLAFAGAASAATPLVDVDWVKANIGKSGVVFLDVRGRLGGQSKDNYLSAHIPGAIWSNYLKDGWRVKDKNGTVGQLPPVAKLEKLIGSLGIGNTDHVIVIPVGGKALDMGTATRIYWTFKVIGHNNVSILDGGMKTYLAATDKKTKTPLNPLEGGQITRAATTFKGTLQKAMLASKSEVAKASTSGSVIIDNRPKDQYLGIKKHGMAKRNGTIPNAKNVPESRLTRNGGGKFEDKGTLKKLYDLAGVPTSGEQINFCNTGHWASLGWFASSEILGNKKAKLYDGSMVEWSADMKLPIQSAAK